MSLEKYREALKSRFLRYVQVHSQSDPHAETFPSSECQWELLRLLEQELRDLGLVDVQLLEHGHLLATVPSKGVESPTVALFAHVDTAPDYAGEGVRPLCHPNYQGEVLRLPDQPHIVLDPGEMPQLLEKIGHELITASGTTLLGADGEAWNPSGRNAYSRWYRWIGVDGTRTQNAESWLSRIERPWSPGVDLG